MKQFLKNSLGKIKNRITEAATSAITTLSDKAVAFKLGRMKHIFGGALLAASAMSYSAEAQETAHTTAQPVTSHAYYHNNTPSIADGNETLLAIHRVKTGGLAIDTSSMNNSGSKGGYIRRDVHTLQESGRLIAFIRDANGHQWQIPVNESGIAHIPENHPAYSATIGGSQHITAESIEVGTLEDGTAHIVATAFAGAPTTSIMSVDSEEDITPTPLPSPTLAPAQQETSTELAVIEDSIPNEQEEQRTPFLPWLLGGASTLGAVVAASMYAKYKEVTDFVEASTEQPTLIPYEAPATLLEEDVEEVESVDEVEFSPFAATAEDIMEWQEQFEETEDPTLAKNILATLGTRFGFGESTRIDIIAARLQHHGYVKIDQESSYYGRLAATLDLATPNYKETSGEVFWIHRGAERFLKIRQTWSGQTQTSLLQMLWKLAERDELPVLQKSKFAKLTAAMEQSEEALTAVPA